jgi:arylsulfatase A-like enzyme
MNSRRLFPRVLLILCLAAKWLAAPFLPAATPPRPNILHIHADDHRADGLGALGNPVLRTPQLDEIVRRGMVFTHCYTQGSMIGAVCLPSRTMLLTGRSLFRIPSGKAATAGEAPIPLPRVLKAVGYETFHAGKSGNEYRAGIEAFDHNLVFDDRTIELRSTSSQRHANAAIEFLRQRDAKSPFYIYLAPPVPHDPRVAPEEFMRMYDADKIPLPAAFLPLHPWNNGDMAVRDERLAPWPRTPEDTKRQIAEYYACISCLDHHVGRIFATLKDLGQLDSTIVVFTGDNGLSLGEHGLFGKQNLYEFGGMHVPLVVAGPGVQQGRSDALVYLMDLFPTFCDLAGAAVPESVEGRSLAPLLGGKSDKVREVLYTAYQNSQRAVRDQRWKLIRYPLVDKTQLFDLQADPHELNNLAYQGSQAAKVAEMLGVLAREQQHYGDAAPLKVDDPGPAEWTPPTGKQDAQKAGSRSRKKAKASQHGPNIAVLAVLGFPVRDLVVTADNEPIGSRAARELVEAERGRGFVQDILGQGFIHRPGGSPRAANLAQGNGRVDAIHMSGHQHVVTGRAHDPVGAQAAHQEVVPGGPGEFVIPGPAKNEVVAGRAGQLVVPVTAVKQ